jgi:GNAT superfamily N-acetyltransferase
VEVRRVGPDDWADLRAVRLRALADAPDAFLTTLADAQASTDDEWRARARRRDAATFLAGDAGMATGLVSPHLDATVELVGMWTAPEVRRTGVGATLVAAVLDWARSQGATRVVLDVAPGNHGATAFYERLGFEATDDPALRTGMPVACDTRFVLQLS